MPRPNRCWLHRADAAGRWNGRASHASTRDLVHHRWRTRHAGGICGAMPPSCCGPYGRRANSRLRHPEDTGNDHARFTILHDGAGSPCACSAAAPGAAAAADQERLLTREWLVTNGLGGYASGTVSGVMTRKYHGLIVAALPAPFGRVVMLNHLAEFLRLPDGRKVALGGEERVGSSPELHGAQYLSEFRLEDGLPVWRFEVGEWTLE